MTCIEELHQQLGGIVLARLEALNAKPAQLKQLQGRLQQLAISGETVQDFPLFQAVTAEANGRRAGSATSRSDSSTQVRLGLPLRCTRDRNPCGVYRDRYIRFCVSEGQIGTEARQTYEDH